MILNATIHNLNYIKSHFIKSSDTNTNTPGNKDINGHIILLRVKKKQGSLNLIIELGIFLLPSR